MQLKTISFHSGWMLLIVFLVSAVFTGIGLFQKPKVYQIASERKNSEILEIEARFDRTVKLMEAEDNEDQVLWKMPPSQSPSGQWEYDLFTPPRIFIHPETGDFEPTAYQFAREASLPHLNLLCVRRPLFKYQFSGFIENDLVDANQSILLIEDLESKTTQRFHFEKNAPIGIGYRMQEFTILRKTTEAGAIRREGQLTILSELGELRVLNSIKPTFSGEHVVSIEFGGDTFDLSGEEPTVTCGGYQITWSIDRSDANQFEFEILNLETSEIHSTVLPSNPTSSP